MLIPPSGNRQGCLSWLPFPSRGGKEKRTCGPASRRKIQPSLCPFSRLLWCWANLFCSEGTRIWEADEEKPRGIPSGQEQNSGWWVPVSRVSEMPTFPLDQGLLIAQTALSSSPSYHLLSGKSHSGERAAWLWAEWRVKSFLQTTVSLPSAGNRFWLFPGLELRSSWTNLKSYGNYNSGAKKIKGCRWHHDTNPGFLAFPINRSWLEARQEIQARPFWGPWCSSGEREQTRVSFACSFTEGWWTCSFCGMRASVS